MPTARTTKQVKKKKAESRKRSRRRTWLTAATSDKHDLYERSVQEPDAEVEFLDKVWRTRRGRLARSLREDFCGTAIASCAWIRHRHDNTAVGVDIDADVLRVAKSRIAERLDERQQQRISVVRADVLRVKSDPVDCVVAMNFSYFLFKKRDVLRRYFERVRASLVRDGMFVLDAYGGSEAFEELEEERDCDGFTYVWDQSHYDPVTGDALNHIHFRFPDGTEMKQAFTYDWRLWTLPEIREVLAEAGFRNITVYWEGTDKKSGEGNGEFDPVEHGEACAGWIAYIVADR